ncbi:uncharacterized protein [Elaeis guineensis]|uniref:uncharacterized protein n=1 Tax=Elaeis guineensis var. tenera TaxID=51953 RepID=UPI003C6D12F5
MRPTDAEIRQFATRKRPASGAGPSRPSKKPTPAPPTVEASATDQSEPVIALAAPTVQAEERLTEEAAEGISAVSPVRVEPDDVQEIEHRPMASVGATEGAGSNSSVPSLPVPSVGAANRGKAPMEPAEEDRSGSRSMPPSAYYPEGASALADHNLARRLCQGILLPADVESLRSRQVAEMLSRFYPTMVELIFTMSELEAGYRRFDNVRAAFKEKSAAAEAERAMLADQLQQSADREAKLIDEVSRLESELRSAKKEAKHKGRAVRRLRRERDGATAELQGEREQLRGSLEKLAEAEEELSIAQIDAELARVEAESAR